MFLGDERGWWVERVSVVGVRREGHKAGPRMSCLPLGVFAKRSGGRNHK